MRELKHVIVVQLIQHDPMKSLLGYNDAVVEIDHILTLCLDPYRMLTFWKRRIFGLASSTLGLIENICV